MCRTARATRFGSETDPVVRWGKVGFAQKLTNSATVVAFAVVCSGGARRPAILFALHANRQSQTHAMA